MTKQEVEKIIDQKLRSMENMSIPSHRHNAWDSLQLDPAVSLLGFPVYQVATASVAPVDIPSNGIIRFQVDITPTYYLWAYINYKDPILGTPVGAWKSAQLT